MLILLAAIDEGYAAGLFGVIAEAMQPFKQLLAIPDDIAVTCCITIGKAADDSRLERPRQPAHAGTQAGGRLGALGDVDLKIRTPRPSEP
jgi:hypothetical protein